VIGDMADWNRDRAEEMRVWRAERRAEAGHRAFREHAAWRLLTIQQDDQAGGNRPLTPHKGCHAISIMQLRVSNAAMGSCGIRAPTFCMPCSMVSSDVVALGPVAAVQSGSSVRGRLARSGEIWGRWY